MTCYNEEIMNSVTHRHRFSKVMLVNYFQIKFLNSWKGKAVDNLALIWLCAWLTMKRQLSMNDFFEL